MLSAVVAVVSAHPPTVAGAALRHKAQYPPFTKERLAILPRSTVEMGKMLWLLVVVAAVVAAAQGLPAPAVMAGPALMDRSQLLGGQNEICCDNRGDNGR
jgi:hypothetical protein